jgi:hypothetical protein
MNAHEPPGTRLLAPSQVAALGHEAELREAAQHARLAALTRATWTDRPIDTSASFRDALASVTAVLRDARNAAIAPLLRRATFGRASESGRRRRTKLDTPQACASC